MNRIDINEILKFTPAQEEFSKYIFNGRLGKCIFYRDSLATQNDIVEDWWENDGNKDFEIFVDGGLPMNKLNEAILELMSDKHHMGRPFIFITTSLFAVRLFQQSLITIVDHDIKGNLVLSTPYRRMYYGNINHTIAEMYSNNELNGVAGAINNLIDKGNYIGGKKPTKIGIKKYGEIPVFSDFEKKFVGQIADSFLRINIEEFAGIEGHFPRDDDYSEEIHGIEVPFSNEQLHEPIDKRR